MTRNRYIFAPYREEEGDAGGAGGDAGDQGGGDGGDTGGIMQQAGAWNWNEDQAGEGDRPEWLAEKYKSVEDQAKAYPELAKMAGKYSTFFGAPEGDYELTLPEDVQGEFDADNPLLQEFQKYARDNNLSQDRFTEMLHMYVQHDAGLVTSQAANAAQVVQELGENGEQVLQDTWLRLNQVLGEDGAKALDAVVGSADAVRALQKLMASEAVLPSGDTSVAQPMSRDEMRAMLTAVYPDDHPKKGRQMYGDDPDYTKKVDNLYNKRFPGEDRQAVG